MKIAISIFGFDNCPFEKIWKEIYIYIYIFLFIYLFFTFCGIIYTKCEYLTFRELSFDKKGLIFDTSWIPTSTKSTITIRPSRDLSAQILRSDLALKHLNDSEARLHRFPSFLTYLDLATIRVWPSHIHYPFCEIVNRELREVW